MKNHWKILMIDDDYEDYLITRSILQDSEIDIELIWAEDIVSAQRECVEDHFDAILVDYDLGEATGLDWIRRASFQNEHAPTILYTSRKKEEIDLQDLETESIEYLNKNKITSFILERTIHYAIERKKTEDTLRMINESLEQRVAERTAELRSAKEILEKVFSTVLIGIAYLDRDFNFIQVNQVYAQFDGRQPEDFPGCNHFDMYPDKENEAIFRQVVETGIPYYAIEKPFTYLGHPDRGVTYWDWVLAPVQEADGQISGLVFTLMDVTERWRSRQELQESQAELAGLFEASPDALLVLSMEGTILRANHQAQEAFGYSLEELIGQPVEMLVPERFREKHAWLRESYSRSPASRTMGTGIDYFGQRKDGSEFPVDIALSPLKQDQITKIICAIRRE